MADFMLLLGCALLAFGPFVSLFTLIVYRKAQLVIVVTTAAFFFLLSSLASGFVWFIFDLIGLGGALAAIIPGVFFQFIFRCLFVAIYHRVEGVIETSLAKQHRDELRESAREQRTTTGEVSDTEPATDDSVAGRQRQAAANPALPQPKTNSWTEAARLRLQLNDASCGVAAGVGFGGMHAILLYGTLLASEISHGGGVLYQSSCPSVPSLAVSGMYSFCFTILDIFWMLFTFFGMRRRLMYHRGEHAPNEVLSVGSWLGNSRNGGNISLLLCLGTHLAASLVTMGNYFNYGCRVAIPSLFVVVLVTAYLFWAGVGRIYMPPPTGTWRVRSESNHVD